MKIYLAGFGSKYEESPVMLALPGPFRLLQSYGLLFGDPKTTPLVPWHRSRFEWAVGHAVDWSGKKVMK